MAETGLTRPRLRGELKRHRGAAAAVRGRRGRRLVPRCADRRAGPGLRARTAARLRRYPVPLGPVLNFAASNFPFAFSVRRRRHRGRARRRLPGDRQGPPRAPGASRADRRDRRRRAGRGRAPGRRAAARLRPGGRASSCCRTGGSRRPASPARCAPAGCSPTSPPPARPRSRSSASWAASTRCSSPGGRGRARAGEIADGFVTSVAGSAGQLCTKPGFLLVPAGSTSSTRADRGAAADVGRAPAAGPADRRRLRGAARRHPGGARRSA